MLVTAPVRGRQRRNDVVVNTVARRLVPPIKKSSAVGMSQFAILRATSRPSDQGAEDTIKLASPVTSKHRDFREERSANLRAFEQLALSIGGLPQAELGRGS
jgi:hypothetical protein